MQRVCWVACVRKHAAITCTITERVKGTATLSFPSSTALQCILHGCRLLFLPYFTDRWCSFFFPCSFISWWVGYRTFSFLVLGLFFAVLYSLSCFSHRAYVGVWRSSLLFFQRPAFLSFSLLQWSVRESDRKELLFACFPFFFCASREEHARKIR